MSPGRLVTVFRRELGSFLRRPLFWVTLGLVTFLSWSYAQGNVRLDTGSGVVGGVEPWITSMYHVAWLMSGSGLFVYCFFVSVAAGMTLIHDEELKVVEVLHATRLRPSEYVWGTFGAITAGFLGILVIHAGSWAFFNHVMPGDATAEQIGPFTVANYFIPALAFTLPVIVFFAGTAFAIGARFKNPILVFVLPVAVGLFAFMFLFAWSPAWLDPRINRLLMMIDPSGMRWLSQTFFEVDRGTVFYNTTPIVFDTGFVLSRLAFCLVGLGAVALVQRHFAGALLGREKSRGFLGRRRKETAVATAATGERDAVAMATTGADKKLLEKLTTGRRRPGFVRATLVVAGAELRDLLTRPGLYLFTPLIILLAYSILSSDVAAFDTRLLLTGGYAAIRMKNALALLVCALLLFYMVESLYREHSTGAAPLVYGSPIRTSSLLTGKVLGNSLVAAVILAAAMLTVWVMVILRQLVDHGPERIELLPFLIVWGLVLLPTFVVWTAFVMALFAVTRSRYATYALGIAALFGSVFWELVGKDTSWVTNWLMWDALRWTDFGVFPFNRAPLVLNRLIYLALAVFLIALTVRLFQRQEYDPTQTVHRLRPKRLFRLALPLAVFATVPVVGVYALQKGIDAGFQSDDAEKLQKDYWRKNLQTWKDAPVPGLAHVELEVEFDPARRWMGVEGWYDLSNFTEEELRQLPISAIGFDDLQWQLDGRPVEPEDRAGLFVFTPDEPLPPGGTIRLGFSYQTINPRGFTKDGGGSEVFVLPSGVVTVGYRPDLFPVIGYVEEIGIDDDNRSEPREYPDDYYKGVVGPALGGAGEAYTTRIRVSGPDEFLYNATGVKVEEDVRDGVRTVLWESDHPVKLFNIVGGRWVVERGEGTAVFYTPRHTYNIEEISSALQAAQRYYSEWFYPYPWEELRLSEFANHAGYAQGFSTNITFSEGIGFTTRSDPDSNLAFFVTAHETAHQWWGNILTGGDGPGGNLLHEGMANYSSALLFKQVHGVQARIEFCKRMETSYGRDRFVDAERPLVKTDGSRQGDQTVTYDKAGWVFWMLHDLMGRDNMLTGLRSFIEAYELGPDYPLLQDFVEHMRAFAPDVEAYDAFTGQWFFEVVVPEYVFRDVEMTALGDGRFRVVLEITNTGTGRMPLEVAAVRGERFPDEDDDDPEPYRDARITVTLGDGESRRVDLVCDFEPEMVLVDPDARVLQLNRKFAAHRF